MSVIDHLLALVAPYECLGCSAEGSLLCGACTEQLAPAPLLCYRCREPSPGNLICLCCSLKTRLYRVQAATTYSGAAKGLVWQLKYAGAKAAARQMADLLRQRAAASPQTVIVPVPTANGRVRRRGYDQARLLARELGRKTQLPYQDLLVRNGKTRQVGTSRAQRLAQLEGAFRIARPKVIAGAHILLIDDVITTGATLETAAGVLFKAGARRIEAAAFCSVER